MCRNKTPLNAANSAFMLVVVLRGQSMTSSGRYFVAAGFAAVDSGRRGGCARIVQLIECFIIADSEVSSISV